MRVIQENSSQLFTPHVPFEYVNLGGSPPKQHVQLAMPHIAIGNKHDHKGQCEDTARYDG